MNSLALAFLCISAAALLALPRRWALVPLLASCFYMTTGQGVEIGSVSLPMYRIILLIGLIRVVVRREGIFGGITVIDKLLVAWIAWMLFASLFHERMPGSGPVYTIGFVGTIALVYLLVRIWSRDMDELLAMFRIVAWLAVPVAITMTLEHRLQWNVFSVLGGVPESVNIRNGEIRAQGPFMHPILAGTVGAVCVPLMIAIWRRFKVSAAVGLAACVVMVVASTSSGPLMSLFIGILAMALWRIRTYMSALRWGLVGLYVSAEIFMERPAYYLMSKFDLTGSSTGWYRSRLIESSIEHLGEWWVWGTDRTAHWMPFQPPLPGGRHSDITNYYLFIGTIGGLPALLLIVAMITFAFVFVGRTIRLSFPDQNGPAFAVWCLGAGMVAHTVTTLSVSYTDQSMMLFWLNIGVISSIYGAAVAQQASLTNGTVASRRKKDTLKQRSDGPIRPEAERPPESGARARNRGVPAGSGASRSRAGSTRRSIEGSSPGRR